MQKLFSCFLWYRSWINNWFCSGKGKDHTLVALKLLLGPEAPLQVSFDPHGKRASRQVINCFRPRSVRG